MFSVMLELINGPSTPRLWEQLHNDARPQAQDNKNNKSVLLFRGVHAKETSERVINVENRGIVEKQQKLGQRFDSSLALNECKSLRQQAGANTHIMTTMCSLKDVGMIRLQPRSSSPG